MLSLNRGNTEFLVTIILLFPSSYYIYFNDSLFFFFFFHSNCKLNVLLAQKKKERKVFLEMNNFCEFYFPFVVTPVRKYIVYIYIVILINSFCETSILIREISATLFTVISTQVISLILFQ